MVFVACWPSVFHSPFVKEGAAPKTVYFFFLESEPQAADLAAIKNAQSSSEQFSLIGRVFYLFAPDGIARSKLAAGAERWLGVTATARNFRTVEKIAGMLD